MTARTDAPPLVVRRLIQAPPERVFRAWSDRWKDCLEQVERAVTG